MNARAAGAAIRAGEPPITVRASYTSGPSTNLRPARVVVHVTSPARLGFPEASAAGQAASTARYFASSAAKGSAHYVLDVGGAATEQHCVPDPVCAYHAPPNRGSLGVEICGHANYDRDQWLSDRAWPAVAAAAARVAELCTRHRIPTTRISVAQLRAGHRGICGHVDVSKAWGQSTHTDPGAGFPWPEFLAAVAEHAGRDAADVSRETPSRAKTADALPALEHGDRDPARGGPVASLQSFLNQHPWMPRPPRLVVDGIYGDNTAAAVKAVQRQMGIADSDGRNVGPRTRAGLWLRGWRG